MNLQSRLYEYSLRSSPLTVVVPRRFSSAHSSVGSGLYHYLWPLRLHWARETEREYDCTQYQQNAYLTYGTREGKAALVYRKKFHNNSTNPRRPRSSPRLPLLAQGYEI